MVSVLTLCVAAMITVGIVPALGSSTAPSVVAPHPVAPGPGARGPADGPSVAPFDPVGSSNPVTQVPDLPSSVRLGDFHLRGPVPSSFGPSGVPPGWEALQSNAQGWGGGGGSGSTASTWHNRFCAGLWPQFENVTGVSAQGAYASGCYGHDEPGMDFQSDLPGSGGNVTWNVTLPNDRNATLNQSDLYSAVWFGMTMTDPYGWMDQCFLELQFYPDQTFYNPSSLYPNWTVNGAWIGAAVAWQIEADNGYEDPCFYEPLYQNGVPGPAFLNMTEGDHLEITMTGYSTSSTGEQLSIIDKTTGQGSNLTMYNYAQGYPIDPAYAQNNYEGSLEWTPGGEFPVSFAFETGHGGNPTVPGNNSYGGCSAGGPRPTPVDPATPCPSYSSGAWANDTLTPWQFQAPTFFNAHATYTPVQVGFTQPEGGMNLVDQTSNGVCDAIEGSAWCTYPWYSYYCATHQFEFGAVDYSGVSSDFGKWDQFNREFETTSIGLGLYPPTNFSIPSCGGGSTLHVGPSTAGSGSVYFLSADDRATTTVRGLLPGTYSLNAPPAPGEGFSRWTTTGGASVATPRGPYTTLTLTGSGSVTAVFTPHPALTTVTFDDRGKGTVGLGPSPFWIGSDEGLATLSSGGHFALAPGSYSLQAYPKPGWNFSYWSVKGGVTIPAISFPYTQLYVTGASGNATVTAWYVPTSTNGTVVLYAVGNGSVSFGSLHVSNPSPYSYSYGIATMPAGSYAIHVTSGSGVTSWQIYYGSPLLISNNSARTFANLENGTAYLEVYFYQGAIVTFHVSPSAGGAIHAANGVGFTLEASGSSMNVASGTYEFAATPSPGFAFSGWATNQPTHISFSPASALTDATIVGGGRITATFVKTTTTGKVSFGVVPGRRAGKLTWDLGTSYGGKTNLTGVAAGQHIVTANPTAGWTFAGWKAGGSVSFVGSSFSPTTVIDLSSGAGTLSPIFAPLTSPLSFVIWNPTGTTASSGTLTVNGTPIPTGETVYLPPGTYSIFLSAPAPLSSWQAFGGMTILSSTPTTAVVSITGGGTIEADLT